MTAIFRRLAAAPLEVPNSSRVHLEAWVRTIADGLPPRAQVLDAGSGEAPYRQLFGRAQYEAADFLGLERPYATPTYECDLTAIPVEDGRYDLVLCTQVLEHVPEPVAVLRELHRVLRPGGRLALSAPLFYEEHGEPYDFFRYTKYGFRHLAEQAGFSVKSIEPLEGYFGTLSYQMTMASRPGLLARSADNLTGWRRRIRLLVAEGLRRSFGGLAVWLSRLDQGHPVRDAGMCKNYRCIFVKLS